jgi:cytochrome c5
MASTALEQNNMIPAEGKKAVSDWIKSYKKGRDDFKAAADEGFKKVETFFAIK